MSLDQLQPDQDRFWNDLTELSRIREPDLAGWTRTLFSEPYRVAREWVRDRMREAGLEVVVDPAGNIVGRLPGHHDAPPLVTGSHTDTVQGGGRFDGVVGVLGAIEVARRLRETDTKLHHDLLVVDFLGEEANPFSGSCLGSRAAIGDLPATVLGHTDAQGRRLDELAMNFGLDPDGLLKPSWAARPAHGYVELHIEQGPTLERTGAQIGIVTDIVGIESFIATFTGRADHAGTRPMDDRSDALVAAARSVLAIERTGCAGPPASVGTCGQLSVDPGARNVVPAQATLSGEFRSPDQPWLSGVRRRVVDEIAALSADNGVEALVEWSSENPVTPMSQSVQELAARAAGDLGLSWKAIPSNAGHDAAHMAARVPSGMIFVPSKDGRSHCPEEWTDLGDVATGVHVLAASLVRMDREPVVRHEQEVNA